MARGKAVETSGLNEGDRVKFQPPHNKALQLVGKVVRVHEDGDLVDVEAEVDGKIVQVEGHVHTVSASSVKPAGKDEEHRHVGDRG
jgi:hypothetical protein